MAKVLRFLAFMAPMVLGSVSGNLLALKSWPELREKSPWFWLLTGSMGAVGGMVATRLLFGRRRTPPTAAPPKTDPVPGPAPVKAYAEWRKDLDRTVDENAPDYLPTDDFVRKWSDVPRGPKPARVTSEPIKRQKITLIDPAQIRVAPQRAPANVMGAPENVIKYVQEQVKNNTFIDPCGGGIRVTQNGCVFHRVEAGPVTFHSDARYITLDGIQCAIPPEGYLEIHVTAGPHFVQAVPTSGLPDMRGSSGHAPLTCGGHDALRPRDGAH